MLMRNYVGGHGWPLRRRTRCPSSIRRQASTSARRRCRRRREVGAGGRCREPRVSRVAPDARHRSRPVSVQAQGSARAALRRHLPHHHAGMRQDARRVARRDATRHRERRSGVRHAHSDSGLQLRRHRGRHRRDHDPPAARRLCDRRAVQFPRHDSVLVPPLCDRVRQHGRAQTLRTCAADDAEGVRARRVGRAAAGSPQPGERRPGRRQRAARSSCGPVDQLRGIERGRPSGLCDGRRRRQTRAVPGRREESCRRPARCRFAPRRRRHRRQRVRLCRPAVSRHVARDYRRRRAHDRFSKPFRTRRGRASTGYGLDEGVQMGPVISPESRARIVDAIDRAVAGGRAGRSSTGARRRSQSTQAGNFVRPTVHRRPAVFAASSRARKSSGRSCRCTTSRPSTRPLRS